MEVAKCDNKICYFFASSFVRLWQTKDAFFLWNFIFSILSELYKDYLILIKIVEKLYKFYKDWKNKWLYIALFFVTVYTVVYLWGMTEAKDTVYLNWKTDTLIFCL